jgi:hypothetical protein
MTYALWPSDVALTKNNRRTHQIIIRGPKQQAKRNGKVRNCSMSRLPEAREKVRERQREREREKREKQPQPQKDSAGSLHVATISLFFR